MPHARRVAPRTGEFHTRPRRSPCATHDGCSRGDAAPPAPPARPARPGSRPESREPTSGTRQGLEREVLLMPAVRRTVRAAGLPAAADAPARLRVGIIGAGRVGAVLGAALSAAGHDVVAASGLSAASAERAARLLPGVPLLPADQVVAAADLVVLAVPDDTLAGLVAGLAETGAWRAGQLAFHTSGAHGLAVLAPAERAGVLPLALHPAMTFTGAPEDADRLAGCPFGVTSAPALPAGRRDAGPGDGRRAVLRRRGRPHAVPRGPGHRRQPPGHAGRRGGGPAAHRRRRRARPGSSPRC